MRVTSKYGYKQPEGEDRVDIEVLNDNADISEEELSKLRSDLNTKAPADSPILTGNVRAQRPDMTTNYVEKVATVGYVEAMITVTDLDVVDEDG